MTACRLGHGTDHRARTHRDTTDITDAGWQAIEPLMPWQAEGRDAEPTAAIIGSQAVPHADANRVDRALGV
ncbi:hypothetical protein [Nonomuraea sp. NPDC049480]|uniref:hypothetical protein n=1 Tax=Nonomuraea sp. NPDC049480 TaxID=3364353 RepID=UPI00378BDD8D